MKKTHEVEIPSQTNEARSSGFKLRNLRWYICGLVFFATGINYIDRQTLSILAPDLQREIGWSELQYGRIVLLFQLAYAVMMLNWGWIIDRIGTKLGYSLGVIWWSFAEIGHGLVRTVAGFGTLRFLLGVGEAANNPSAMKAISEWFPASERGLATGIFNSATSLGAISAPILVPVVAVNYGWKGAFIATGLLGAVWMVIWLIAYRRPEVHPWLEKSELEWIQSGSGTGDTPHIPWGKVLGCRQTWAFATAKLLTDPVWSLYLFWLPKFLAQTFGIRGTALTKPLSFVYIVSSVGAILGGYLSSTLIRRGWTVNKARKISMLIMAALVPLVMISAYTRNLELAMLSIGIAMAAHQGFATNVMVSVSDMFPNRAVASVVGIGGMMGAFGGVAAAELTGRVLQNDPNAYLPLFAVASMMYFAGVAAVHLLAPRLERADL